MITANAFLKEFKSQQSKVEKTIPGPNRTGDRLLDIQIYTEVRPFVAPATFIEGAHVLFRICTGHREGGKLLVFT